MTENFPWQLSEQLFIRTSFFPGQLCGCFRTLFSSTRLLFLLCFYFYICCFVVFIPVIKFNFHNGWFEHRKEVLGIWDKDWHLTKRLFHSVIDKSNWDTTHTHKNRNIFCIINNVLFQAFATSLLLDSWQDRVKLKMLFFWWFIVIHSPWIEGGEWWPRACLFLPRQAWNVEKKPIRYDL